MAHLIAPSLLSADFSDLRKDIEMVNSSVADWFHLDVMDGVFVPNISFGTPVIEAVKRYASKPLDVHLMIVNPDKFIDDYHKMGADILNVHCEACTHLHRTIQKIKSLGMKAGVTLNPHTSITAVEEILPDLDVVMLMSVNPGFGGQKFIENTLDKTYLLTPRSLAIRSSDTLSWKCLAIYETVRYTISLLPILFFSTKTMCGKACARISCR